MAGDSMNVKVHIYGDIVPRKPDMKPADVLTIPPGGPEVAGAIVFVVRGIQRDSMNHGEIVRQVQAQGYSIADVMRNQVESDTASISEAVTGKEWAIKCESQPPLSDFAAVLTAVMALSEPEQQQVYEALYKAGHRIYRE